MNKQQIENLIHEQLQNVYAKTIGEELISPLNENQIIEAVEQIATAIDSEIN